MRQRPCRRLTAAPSATSIASAASASAARAAAGASTGRAARAGRPGAGARGLLCALCALAGLLAAGAGAPVAAAPAAHAASAAPAAHAAPAAGTAPGYHLIRTIPLGGEGGWDYLTFDTAARRLYITRGSRVTVLDGDTGKVVGEIPNLSGVHGVALAPELGRGFISNGRSDAVTVFDTKDLKVLSEIKSTGQNPDAILYDPASRRVFAFNGRTGNVTVIDAASGKVAATIPVGGKLEFAASDRKGMVFVNVEDKNEVVAIDAAKAVVARRWPLTGCEEPSGMAIDAAHQRLVIGCGNETALIVDSASGRVVAKLPIGKGVDANGFDPGTGLAFASCGDGTLTVIHEDTPDKWTVVAKVPTRPRARTMALDEKTHDVYLATAEFGPAPAPTAAEPHPRPAMVPGSFVILVVGP
jgi:YVTN family beta-propeller protein